MKEKNKPLQLCLLSNPNSGRNRQDMSLIRHIASEHPDIHQIEANNPATVAKELTKLGHSNQINVLAINGGDGTIQATLTALFNQKPFREQPILALLPGGTTNITAGDVGLKGNRKKALKKLIAWAKAPNESTTIQQRPILRVQNGFDQPALYGMVFGTGAITKGIKYYHDTVLKKGLRNDIGPGLSTLRVVFGMICGDPSFVAPVNVSVDNKQLQSIDEFPLRQDYFLLLVSTLTRLFFGIHPHWNNESNQALQFTAIRSHPKHAIRTLPFLFWGHSARFGTPDNGYYSYKVNELELAFDSEFTLDGELYKAEQRLGPVTISHGGTLSFMQFQES